MTDRSEQTYDLLAAEIRANPYPIYRELRERCPVHFNLRSQAWVVMRYADVAANLRDTALMSSDRAHLYVDRLPADVQHAVAPLVESMRRWPSFSDPPYHTRVRKLLNKAFSQRMIESLRPVIVQVLDELVDGRDQSSDHMDLIGDVASTLPMRVITRLVGVEPRYAELFHQWSQRLIEFWGSGFHDPGAALRANQSCQEVAAVLHDAVARRRAHPEQDLVSAMVQIEDEGAVFSDDEIVAINTLLLSAGHETTTGFIGLAFHTLFAHPDLLERVRETPSIMPEVIEELLRYDGPVQMLARMPTRDVELGGHTIRRGERVMLMLGAANRDPDEFPDPDALRLDRPRGVQLGFGFGPHFCPGAALARLEVRTVIDHLLRRFPGLAMTESPLEWNNSLSIRGLKRLPVTLS